MEVTTYFHPQLYRQSFLVVLILMMTACGGGGNPLPIGSEVVISPREKTWDITPAKDENGDCIWSDDFYQDEPILISVKDAQGSPIGKIDLSVSLDLSGNTFSGVPALKLYEDRNSNGVPDDPDELVTSNTDPLFTTETKRYTGEKVLILRMNLSCQYKGQLFVSAGSFQGFADFEVNEVQEVQP